MAGQVSSSVLDKYGIKSGWIPSSQKDFVLIMKPLMAEILMSKSFVDKNFIDTYSTILTAQCGVESAWGKSKLDYQYNNYSGMTAGTAIHHKAGEVTMCNKKGTDRNTYAVFRSVADWADEYVEYLNRKWDAFSGGPSQYANNLEHNKKHVGQRYGGNTAEEYIRSLQNSTNNVAKIWSNSTGQTPKFVIFDGVAFLDDGTVIDADGSTNVQYFYYEPLIEQVDHKLLTLLSETKKQLIFEILDSYGLIGHDKKTKIQLKHKPEINNKFHTKGDLAFKDLNIPEIELTEKNVGLVQYYNPTEQEVSGLSISETSVWLCNNLGLFGTTSYTATTVSIEGEITKLSESEANAPTSRSNTAKAVYWMFKEMTKWPDHIILGCMACMYSEGTFDYELGAVDSNPGMSGGYSFGGGLGGSLCGGSRGGSGEGDKMYKEAFGDKGVQMIDAKNSLIVGKYHSAAHLHEKFGSIKNETFKFNVPFKIQAEHIIKKAMNTPGVAGAKTPDEATLYFHYPRNTGKFVLENGQLKPHSSGRFAPGERHSPYTADGKSARWQKHKDDVAKLLGVTINENTVTIGGNNLGGIDSKYMGTPAANSRLLREGFNFSAARDAVLNYCIKCGGINNHEEHYTGGCTGGPKRAMQAGFPNQGYTWDRAYDMHYCLLNKGWKIIVNCTFPGDRTIRKFPGAYTWLKQKYGYTPQEGDMCTQGALEHPPSTTAIGSHGQIYLDGKWMSDTVQTQTFAVHSHPDHIIIYRYC